MKIQAEVDLLLEQQISCIECSARLAKESTSLRCINCRRAYQRDTNGVWSFCQTGSDSKSPEIFRDPEYVRWRALFEQIEVKDWAIYNNPLKRFFSQAGHRKLAKILAKSLDTERDIILEIGSGSGVLLKYLPPIRYIAVEWSYESLKLLKSTNPAAIAIYTDSSTLPFQESVFTAVTSLHTLEHIYYLGEHLEEVKRVLKDRRHYYFVIPTEGGFAFWLGRQLFTRKHLRKNYGLDVNLVMDREHINDASRVLKFLRMYFDQITASFWPLRLPILGVNAVIFGSVLNRKS